MNPAQAIIQKFGGVRAMAAAVGKSPSVVHYWSTRGHIPAKHIGDVRAAAASRGISLDPSEFIEVAA